MKKIIGYLLLAAGVACILYLRFSNIDMTEARILVTYPFEVFVCVAASVIGMLVAHIDK